MKPITAIGLALAAAITCKLLHKRSQRVGAMTDPMPTLDNLKRGIANGWYTAKLTTFDGQQAVELSGKLTDGTPYVDIYPITEDIAKELSTIIDNNAIGSTRPQRYFVILNGDFLMGYANHSGADKLVGKIQREWWWDNDANLLEIYDKETGETIWSNE